MEQLTSEETAQKKDISARRVTDLCKEGRIEGTIQVAKDSCNEKI